MESIATLSAQELQEQKSQALRATRLWKDSITESTRRARYTAGTIAGRQIPSYADEPGVDPALNTETLAEITLEVNNNRWKGVPIVLRSGKALGDPRKQIIIRFRPVTHIPGGFSNYEDGDHLIINLKPGAISLSMTMNAEGDPLELERKHLSTTLSAPQMLPYGEVLGHILDGNQLLSVSAEAAVECWRIVDPVLKAWANNEVPLEEYEAGSTGPKGWDSNDFWPRKEDPEEQAEVGGLNNSDDARRS